MKLPVRMVCRHCLQSVDMSEDEARTWRPIVVFVDEKNQRVEK